MTVNPQLGLTALLIVAALALALLAKTCIEWTGPDNSSLSTLNSSPR
ncbi:MAG: hypothetical protein NTY01_09280 [Verrucomicrobia bacterium]|nr:hypothetical protein [Verrucomicrobiota bacterium]